MSNLATLLPLVVVGVIASFAGVLGLLLYRHSSAVVKRKSLRLTGATAIAWLFFLSMSQFYLRVSANIRGEQQVMTQALRGDLDTRIQDYRECSLQEGDFRCKAPADQLLRACDSLLRPRH